MLGKDEGRLKKGIGRADRVKNNTEVARPGRLFKEEEGRLR